MRVLLLVHYYFPNIQSCGGVMHDLAVELRERGHEVVLAAPDDSLETTRTITREAGFTVLRVRSGRFRGVSRAVRAANEWRLPRVMWNGARDFFRDHPCGLIVNYSPTIFFGPLVRRLKRMWGSFNYLVLRDIFPQWSVDAGMISEGGPVHRFFRHYERLLYDTADVIGVQSRRNLDYFEQRGLTERYLLEVLYNWVPVAGQEVAAGRFRSELGLEGRVVFFYGGNLGVAQDAGSIVRLAAAMRQEEQAFFLVAGDGSEADRLAREAADRGLENLRFLPPVDRKTYLGLVAETDVGLVTLRRGLTTHNFPGKMLDYMYLGKPMLAAVNPGNDLKDLLEEHDSGLVCWNGDDDRFASNCRLLARDAGLRQRLGRNARRLLESKFSTARAARQILGHVRD